MVGLLEEVLTRLRETGTTRDDYDQDRRFADYASFLLTLRIVR